MSESLPQELIAGRVAEWNRHLNERVGRPLRPEELRSVFLIVPSSSGDVALATTVVRYIKERNPRCKVSCIVKRPNLPLLEMCPGVDERLEFPPETESHSRSRLRRLAEYAGRADAVIYPICDPEDMDLLQRFNFLETIWLLSGVPDRMPTEPQRLWLTPTNVPETAARVLARCVSKQSASDLTAEARRQPGKLIRFLLRHRTVRNAGWKNGVCLLRHAAYIRKVSIPDGSWEAARRFVIVSSEAVTLPNPPPAVFQEIFRFLRAQGRIVLHNVTELRKAAFGTIPLQCSYHEFLCLRELGIPFVGLRSGLCDIASASQTPMCVIQPSTFKGCGVHMRANMAFPITSFGYASMNVAANCVELVYDDMQDMDLTRLATILEQRPPTERNA